MGLNIFQTGMDAFGAGYDQQNKMRSDRAKLQAGRAIAGGDYTGGAAALNSAGMIDEGHNVIADQQQLQDRQATFDAAETKRKATALINVAQGLKMVPVGQRQAALQSKLPIFQSMKIDTTPFQSLGEAQLSDASLDQFAATLGKAADEYTLGEGQKRFRNGTVIAQGDPKPQDYLIVPEGGKAFPKPNQGQTVSNPAPMGGGMAPTTSAPSGDQPRGLRNNNPLNVTALSGGQKWDGQTGVDGAYAVFATPEAGVLAADKNLAAYGAKHGINTLSGVIQRWAPQSGGNDTASYIATVSKSLGIDPNQPIDLTNENVRHHVLDAMSQVELGRAGGLAAPQRQTAQAAPTQAQPGDPPGTMYGAPKPVAWQPDGKGNLVNSVTGDRKVDPTFDGAGAADPNVVKMVLDGRYPPPTGRAATDPKWQAVLQAAAAQDPNFNAADYHTRYATRKDFTSGKAAQNITSLNTALGHIGDLDSQVENLGNTPFHMVNAAKNMFANATGDPKVQRFNTTKAAVASELVRVFRQAGGTEADIKDFQKPLDDANSPEQLHQVTREMVKLLASRLDAMSQQYKQGLGQDKGGLEFLNPKARAIFTKILGVPDTSAPAPAPTGGAMIRYDAQGNRIG